jgi:excisionase family DNA binding protein
MTMKESQQSMTWMTVKEAAQRARCGPKLIYREVKADRLKAARVGGRRELRLLPEWIDQWLLDSVTPKAALSVTVLGWLPFSIPLDGKGFTKCVTTITVSESVVAASVKSGRSAPIHGI